MGTEHDKQHCRSLVHMQVQAAWCPVLTCADNEQQGYTQLSLDRMRRHAHLASVDGGMPGHPHEGQRMWQRLPVGQRLSVLDLITNCRAASARKSNGRDTSVLEMHGLCHSLSSAMAVLSLEPARSQKHYSKAICIQEADQYQRGSSR